MHFSVCFKRLNTLVGEIKVNTKCCFAAVLMASVMGAAMGSVIGSGASASPLFPNSVASNDLDFIHSNDPSVFACFKYLGERTQEMPGHPTQDLMANGVFTYEMLFEDGTRSEVWVHYDIGSEDAARVLVQNLGPRFGRLPTAMRGEVGHIVIHAGDGSAFAEDRGKFFVLYADNMATRIANHDLEETLFHESAHVAFDLDHARSRVWQRAQRADADFVTQYAASHVEQEDLAESALFAYAMTKHAGRLPEPVEQSVRDIMPNRLAFLEELFAGPVFTQAGPKPDC